jgi:hypothetical protein
VRARLFGDALANGLGSGLVLGFHADGDGIRWIRPGGVEQLVADAGRVPQKRRDQMTGGVP